MPSPRTVAFNYGSLVARIGSGPPFMILPNDFTYTTKCEGPLYLKMFLPKNFDVNPEGSLEVKIYDGKYMPIEEIYEKIGWREGNLENSIKETTDLENNIIITINQLRMNPILFYEQNIRDNQKIIWTEEYLKQKFKSYNDNNKDVDIINYDIEPLIVNDKCYNLLNNLFFKNHDIKSKIIKNKINVFLEELEHYLNSSIKDELSPESAISCKLTKKRNSIDICILFLLDQKYRNNIFNNKYNSIAFKFVENYYEESHLIVLAISKTKI